MKRGKRVHYINIAWKCTFCNPELNIKITKQGAEFKTGFMQSKYINKYAKYEGENIFCDQCGRLIGHYTFEKHGGFNNENT